MKAIQEALRDKQRVLVVGGGLLGLEAAYGLMGLGKQVHVLEAFPYLLPRQLDPHISDSIRQQLEAEGSPLVVNRGIVVDTSMRTNLPDVYAAGDVAEIDGMLYGLWAPAMAQGKVAGANLAGGVEAYVPTQLAATLSIGRVKLFSAGEINDADAHITHEEDALFHRLYGRDGRVAGIVLTGDLSLSMKAKALVAQQKDLPPEDISRIKFHDLFREIVACSAKAWPVPPKHDLFMPLF